MKWFNKKSRDASPQLVGGDRYAGKPLLILLENYVLSCIGLLAPEKDSAVAAAVQRVYGGGTDWKATLRAQLSLGEGIDESLQQMWSRNQEIAHAAGQSLSPEDFARMVVDENFVSLLT